MHLGSLEYTKPCMPDVVFYTVWRHYHVSWVLYLGLCFEICFAFTTWVHPIWCLALHFRNHHIQDGWLVFKLHIETMGVFKIKTSSQIVFYNEIVVILYCIFLLQGFQVEGASGENKRSRNRKRRQCKVVMSG